MSASCVTLADRARASCISTTKELMPAPEQSVPVRLNQPCDCGQLGPAEPARTLQGDGLQPHLRHHVLPPHVDVGRLAAIQRDEEEAIRAHSEDRRHAFPILPLPSRLARSRPALPVGLTTGLERRPALARPPQCVVSHGSPPHLAPSAAGGVGAARGAACSWGGLWAGCPTPYVMSLVSTSAPGELLRNSLYLSRHRFRSRNIMTPPPTVTAYGKPRTGSRFAHGAPIPGKTRVKRCNSSTMAATPMPREYWIRR